MKDFYVLTSWDAMHGRREIIVRDHVPFNSDIKYVGPLKAYSSSQALRMYKRFLRTGTN